MSRALVIVIFNLAALMAAPFTWAESCPKQVAYTPPLWKAADPITLIEANKRSDDFASQAVAFSPDSKYVATGSNDGKIRLWDLASGRKLLTSAAGIKYPWQIDFVNNGKKLMLFGSNAEKFGSQLLDTKTGARLRADSNTIERFAQGSAIIHRSSPKDPYDHELVDLDTSRPVLHWRHKPYDKSVFGIGLEGPQILRVTKEEELSIISTKGERAVGKTVYVDPNRRLSFLSEPSFSAISNRAYYRGILWNTADGSEITRLVADEGNAAIQHSAFSSDGQGFLYSLGKAVKVLDAKSGSFITSICAEAAVFNSRFSSDGTIVLGTTTEDILGWDSKTGQLLIRIPNSGSTYWSFAMSPDKKSIAATQENARVTLWRVQGGE